MDVVEYVASFQSTIILFGQNCIICSKVGDLIHEIQGEESEEEEKCSLRYILGPGLRREGSKVFAIQSGVLKCKQSGKTFFSISWSKAKYFGLKFILLIKLTVCERVVIVITIIA